jgi:SAM-dependent methyltransferase
LDDFIESTRSSYDILAQEYADRLFDELSSKPLDRALLNRFAEEVEPLGLAIDLGCGPGQVARYLHERGLPVMGVDLSPAMVTLARQLTPGVEFVTGDMLDLREIPDAAWGGIAAFYSIVHIPRAQMPRALGELKRVLVPGGVLLLAFHRGSETLHRDELWGKRVNMDFIFFERAEIQDCLTQVGFNVLEVSERAPYPEVEHSSHRVYIFARKPFHNALERIAR